MGLRVQSSVKSADVFPELVPPDEFDQAEPPLMVRVITSVFSPLGRTFLLGAVAAGVLITCFG